MNPRNPEYRCIRSESDLIDLIPGDRVKVSNYENNKWMTYQRLDHGQGNEGLNQKSKISFIGIPQGYNGEEQDFFNVWSCYVKYLQFDGKAVDMSHLHKNLFQIKQNSGQYLETKSLVDKLVK